MQTDMRTDIAARERLIVALDVDTLTEALQLVSGLGNGVSFYKVGLQLFMAGGLGIVKRIVEEGKKVFLDLKVDDTPRTVQEAVRNSAIDGVEFFTLQGNADTARAARAGRLGAGVRPGGRRSPSCWTGLKSICDPFQDIAHGPRKRAHDTVRNDGNRSALPIPSIKEQRIAAGRSTSNGIRVTVAHHKTGTEVEAVCRRQSEEHTRFGLAAAAPFRLAMRANLDIVNCQPLAQPGVHGRDH